MKYTHLQFQKKYCFVLLLSFATVIYSQKSRSNPTSINAGIALGTQEGKRESGYGLVFTLGTNKTIKMSGCVGILICF